jgi:hypothetical protein
MIKPSGSIARKRKNVERRREAAVLSNLPKSAESGFRSFETGDYSNEIMGLASAAGFLPGVAGKQPQRTGRSVTRDQHAAGTRPKLQILTIPQMLQRVAFIMRPV